MSFQEKLYIFLEEPERSKASLVFNMFIFSLIVLSIFNLMLSTVSIYQKEYGEIFETIRNIVMPIFIVEYILRFYASGYLDRYKGIKGKIRYFFSFYAMVDFIAILPYILINTGINSSFVRSLRLLRVFRLFRAKKYANFLQLMKTIFNNIKEELAVLMLFIAIVLVMLSFVMYEVEHDAQPENFSNIFQTLWWSVATLTTIGYGDVYPVTPLGKFITAIISLLSIGFVAIPGGMFASEFMSELNKKKNKPEESCPHCNSSQINKVDTLEFTFQDDTFANNDVYICSECKHLWGLFEPKVTHSSKKTIV